MIMGGWFQNLPMAMVIILVEKALEPQAEITVLVAVGRFITVGI
jgi:fumarate reductase subunit C